MGTPFQRHESISNRNAAKVSTCESAALAIAAELPADQVPRFEWRDCLEHLYLFIADRLAVGSDRRLHGQIGQHLKQVILDHIANGAGLIVEGSAALDPERLRHRDLHALDVAAVTQRLEERINKAEKDHIVDRPLPQIVVDPKNRFLVEGPEQDPVELLRRGDIMTKGFFDDDAGALGAAGLGQLLDHKLEQRRRTITSVQVTGRHFPARM